MLGLGAEAIKKGVELSTIRISKALIDKLVSEELHLTKTTSE